MARSLLLHADLWTGSQADNPPNTWNANSGLYEIIDPMWDTSVDMSATADAGDFVQGVLDILSTSMDPGSIAWFVKVNQVTKFSALLDSTGSVPFSVTGIQPGDVVDIGVTLGPYEGPPYVGAYTIAPAADPLNPFWTNLGACEFT